MKYEKNMKKSFIIFTKPLHAFFYIVRKATLSEILIIINSEFNY